MKTRLIASVCVLGIHLASGCSVAPSAAPRTRVAARNIIFNPEWIQLPTQSFSRVEWPVTDAYDMLGEDIAYRETIWDWQGRSGGRGEQPYYRRFHSVRTGEARR